MVVVLHTVRFILYLIHHQCSVFNQLTHIYLVLKNKKYTVIVTCVKIPLRQLSRKMVVCTADISDWMYLFHLGFLFLARININVSKNHTGALFSLILCSTEGYTTVTGATPLTRLPLWRLLIITNSTSITFSLLF